MSRNREQFGVIPSNSIPRAKFPMFQKHTTTCNMGDIIPFFIYSDVIPGDTWHLETSIVARLQTPKFPTMDALVCDVYWFSQLWRNLWRHTNEFFGENTAGAWKQTTEYTIPKVTAPDGGWPAKSIADYMGIATKVQNIKGQRLSINALQFRMYANTCNEWLRNQATTAPYIDYDTDLGDATISANTTDQSDRAQALRGLRLIKACKLTDLFVSALPEPQKGNAVTIPIGTTANVYIDTNNPGTGIWNPRWQKDDGTPITQASYVHMGVGSDGRGYLGAGDARSGAGQAFQVSNFPNLYADLTDAVAATINSQRLAWAIQRILEKDARGGTRYTEIISYQYGVHAEDETLQIPRYLGGERFPIQVDQVLQTSETTADGTALGETGAYSWTSNHQKGFTQSFTKHMVIMGVLVIRQYTRTYQQGIAPQWWRTRRFDVYIPSLANVGEMPIPTKWIYAEGGDDTFGFMAPWEDYRFLENRVSAEMRSNYPQSQDAWHYADEYADAPVLSDEFVKETPAFVDRTLIVPSTTQDQFKLDIVTSGSRTAPIPMYGVPGLVDHM